MAREREAHHRAHDGGADARLKDVEADLDELERLIEAVWRLETLPDMAALVSSSSSCPS